MMKIVGDNAILELDLLEKEHPESENVWDQQWLRVNIKAQLEGFQAFFDASIMRNELNLFIDSISNVLDAQKGMVELHTLEKVIHLKGDVDYAGNIEWEGILIYPVGIGNKLNFSFKTDFYQLQRIKDALKIKLSEPPLS